MKLQSIHRYLSLLVMPLLLYVGFICITYWANTSEQWWIRIAPPTVYGILPLFIIKILHKEELTSRLGLKKGLPMIGLYYCVASVGIVAISAVPISYYQNVLPSQLYPLVLAPITEEIFFRGYILGNISKLHKHIAVAISAFLFGAMHYMVAPPTIQAAYYFIGGFILGYAYLYFDSILVPIIFHQVNNILASISSSWFYQPFPWNFVVFVLPFSAFFNAVFVFVYEYYKRVLAAPRCWMCGKTESEIRQNFPQVKNVLENYPVGGRTVNMCFICRRLILAASEKKNEEG